jgi:hypothetical protein
MERMEQERLEGYNEVHPGTPIHTTHFQPEQELYEGQGIEENPHDVATSPEHVALLNANAMPLDLEHPLSGYNDEGNTYLSVYNHKQGPPWDWAEDQEELPPRMPTPTTFYEPEYNVYEARCHVTRVRRNVQRQRRTARG